MNDRPVRRFLALLLVVLTTATFAFVSPQRAAGQAASDLSPAMMPIITKAAGTKFAPEAEQALLDLLNGLRKHHGFQSLLMNGFLREAARRHSREMALGGFIGHESSMGSVDVRLSTVVRPGTLVAENVTFASTIEQAESAFEASPGHLKNILDPQFNSVGIGIVVVSQGLLVTEDFAD